MNTKNLQGKWSAVSAACQAILRFKGSRMIQVRAASSSSFHIVIEVHEESANAATSDEGTNMAPAKSSLLTAQDPVLHRLVQISGVDLMTAEHVNTVHMCEIMNI